MDFNEIIKKEAQIGFEFEFYTHYDDLTLSEILTNFLKKKVVYPLVFSELNRITFASHTDFKVNREVFKLEHDFSGGPEMRELVTGYMPYEEGIVILEKMLTWIKNNGYTNDRCGIHINVSFKDVRNLKLKNDIINIDRLKLCLNFDEEFIYKLFPNRKNNVYCLSIKNIFPAYPFFLSDDVRYIYNFKDNFLTPSTKYYGINFLKLKNNYLEYRYIGGEKYEEKFEDILKVIDYIILNLFKNLKEVNLTSDEIFELNKIMKKFKKLSSSMVNVESFILNYSENIKLFIDLNDDIQILKTFYNSIKDQIFKIIVFGGLKRGLLNYDTSRGKIQIKDGYFLNGVELNDVEIFNSILENVHLNFSSVYESILENVIITDSKIFKNNRIKNSKVNNCEIIDSSNFENSYIEIKNKELFGEFNSCIIRWGELTDKMKVDDKTIFVEKFLKTNLEKINKLLNSNDRIRILQTYKW